MMMPMQRTLVAAPLVLLAQLLVAAHELLSAAVGDDALESTDIAARARRRAR